MIVPALKSVFVHIPKTGGTSVEFRLGWDGSLYDATLDAAWAPKKFREPDFEHFTGWDNKNLIWLQHATMAQMNDLSMNDLSGYYKFGFVRNPWDRALSDYMFLRDHDQKIQGTFLDYLYVKGEFEIPLTKKLDKDRDLKGKPRWRGDHIIPQYDFLFDKNGKQLVDFIGRFERLQKDFLLVCKNLAGRGKPVDKIIKNRNLPFKKANRDKTKHYWEYYNDESRDLVAEKYKKDIQYFGYEFGK